ELLVALGRHSAAIGELRELLAEDPLREHLWRQLLTALLADGRPAEALTGYAQLRRVLADELGVEPSPELRRIHASILADVDGSAAAGSAFPVCQLPYDIADFTGRAAELGLLRDAATRDSAPVVVVGGAPGVGKTAFAVHAAHSLRGDFPDGQLHVELGGSTASPAVPVDVLGELLPALGLAREAVPPTLRERAALYRSRLADRRLLVLLDDAADVAQVRPLLPATSGCLALVTSRTRLVELAGGYDIALDPLPLSDAVGMLGRVAGTDRIAADPVSATAIAESCGRQPLALRIAGAKLTHHHSPSVRRLAERLADEPGRLSELRVGTLDVRTGLHAAYQRLPGEARRVLRMLATLGVPPATGHPGWLAGALLDDADPEPVLDHLVDAHLLTLVPPGGPDPVPAGKPDRVPGGEADLPRYQLPELLRLHVRQLAEADPVSHRRAALTRALAGWLALAEQAAGRLHGGVSAGPATDAPRWLPDAATVRTVRAAPLAWFDTERASLLAAIGRAAADGLDDLAADLALAVCGYLDLRGHHDDWSRSHDQALAAARRSRLRRAEAALLRGLGQVALYQDRYPDALRCLQQAATLFRELGDEPGLAMASCGLGACARIRGRHTEALDRYRRALRVFVASGDRHREAYARFAIGGALMAQRRYDEADAELRNALRLAETYGDSHRHAHVVERLAQLHWQRGDLDQAMAGLQDALARFTEIGDRQGEAYALQSIGSLHAVRGQSAEAAGLLARALATYRRLGDRRAEASASLRLGELHRAHGRPDEARGPLRRSLALWRDLDAGTEAAQAQAELDLLG
ncbi:MAG: tetratricopeptide repeat protein, partial [Micromonosporaceae bacterium]